MLLKWRLLNVFIFVVFLVLFSVSKVLAVPGTLYLYAPVQPAGMQFYTEGSTAPTLRAYNLEIGTTLMVYDNNVLVRTIGVGATSLTFNLGTLDDGAHGIKANMIDSVGATGPLSWGYLIEINTSPMNTPVLYSINGQTGPSTSSSNNVSLLVTNLSVNDYLTVYDNGSTVVTDILALGTSEVVNISAVAYGEHSYKVTLGDRGGNVSDFSNTITYTRNGTDDSALLTPRFLGNPLKDGTIAPGRFADPSYYPRNIWDMQIFDGKIYFGSGNSSNNAPSTNYGPINLWYYNLGTTEFGKDLVVNQSGTTNTYVDEDQVDKLRVLNGQLWTPGHDSRESWSLGNAYRYDNNGVWTKFRTIPNGVHVYDLAYFNGKIYTALGLDSSDEIIYESSDGGTTWTGVLYSDLINSMRVYELFTFNSQLYGLDYVNYGNDIANNHIFKLSGSSFTRHSMLGTNLIPQSSKTLPISGFEEGFRIIRPTEFGGKLYFILANGSNDHQWAPVKFYKTSDMENGTLINLTDGAVPYDIKVDGSTIYVLAAKKLSHTSYINYVFSSSNGSDWSELFHFNYQTYALSFEEINGDFYFGMGTGEPPLWADISLADSDHLSAKAGDVLEIKEEDYLVQTPDAPTGLSGLIGDGLVNIWWQTPVSDGGAPISDYKIEYKLSAGSDWSIFNDGVSVGVSATVTGLMNELNYDFRVSAINIIGTGNTSAILTLMPIGETSPPPEPTPTLTPTPTDTLTPTPTDTLTPTPTNTPTLTPTPVRVGATNIGELITNNVFVAAAGTSVADTSKITIANETFINLGNGTTINLALNTEITRLDNQNFDANLISVVDMVTSEVSNFPSGFVPQAVMQWGIPAVTLAFSSPVAINMYAGNDLNGQTLSIFRSANTSSGWTSDGIVSPATCVVTNGFCQFSTTEASYFSLALYQTPASNNNSSSNNSSSSSGGGVSVCGDAAPKGNPDLFQIQANKGKVKLFYSPTTVATGYAVVYGLKKGDERFGTITQTINNNRGVQNVEIKSLNPKLTYYFKVAALNGCNASAWSDWVPVQANAKKNVFKYMTVVKNKIKTLVNRFK